MECVTSLVVVALIVLIGMVWRSRRQLKQVSAEVAALKLQVTGLQRRMDVPPAPEPAVSAKAPEPVAWAQPVAPEPEPVPPVPEIPPAPTTPEIPVIPEAPAAPEPLPEAPAAPPAPFVPPPRPEPRPVTPPRKPIDWEGLVGVKLFSWIAGILLALAAVQFLRYSIDHGWLSPPVRMAIGLLVGAGLLVVCELKAARRYAVTANALDAAGIAILFSTVFAAHALWQLLGAFTAFALMVLITAVAVGLSIRRNSLFIALLGLIGGFATPALLSTGENRPIGLFGYLLLLNAGLAWVAVRQRWKLLPLLALLGTTFYQWGWVAKFLDAGQLPLAVGIFLIFPVLAFAVPWLAGRREGEEAEPAFARISAAAATLPLAFALYLAAVPAYGGRYNLLFGFLFLLAAGLAVIAAARGPRGLHPLAGGIVLTVFALWFGLSYTHAAWPAMLAWLALFVALYLAAPWLLGRRSGSLAENGRLGALAAPLLLAGFSALVLLEPAAAAPGLLFGVLFLLLAAAAGFALLYEDGRLHFLAAFFALAAEALWSAKHLNPDNLIAGISLYGLFGLFYLGVPLLAQRLGRTLQPAGSGAILLLASLGLLFFLAAGPVAPSALWGLALLLAVLNAGLFLEARADRWPWTSVAGMLLSWILIAVWWASAPLGPNLIPALVVVAGLAVLALGGNLWLQRSAAEGAQQVSGSGLSLALVGHLFLLFVAARPDLAIPPWPLLGVMAVLDLALFVAALWSRRGALQIGGLAASGLVLLVWQAVSWQAPWPTVAALCAAGLVLFALLGIGAARRVAGAGGELARSFGTGALASLFLGQAILLAPFFRLGVKVSAGFGLLFGLHLAFLAAILVLSAVQERRVPAFLSIVATALASNPGSRAWELDLLFAGAVYGIYLLWPLLAPRLVPLFGGERNERSRMPFQVAVVASVPFFFAARHALLRGGYGDWIGALPVVQAIALSLLLVRLIRLHPPEARRGSERGLFALVAGGALAFLTVAIPLQLERQWITIGWALLAAALAWLYGRIPHRGLLVWAGGLIAAVFVRLAFNPAVLHYHPRGNLPIWNWYLYTYGIAALALLAAATLLRRLPEEPRLPPAPLVPRLSTLASAGGVILLFLLVNIEIADFFSTGDTLTFGFLTGRASLPEDLAYTLGWALFALGLLAAGLALRNRPARIAAILLLVGAVLKGFLHDLARLGGLYRVGSFVGLAASLALVAVLLQKFVLSRREEE